MFAAYPIEFEKVDALNCFDSVVIIYPGGEAVAPALFNLLFGKTNFCGKLAETWMLKYDDVYCSCKKLCNNKCKKLCFPGDGKKSFYVESVYVGYRYYQSYNQSSGSGIPILYPFGFGLSYTTFDYGKEFKTEIIKEENIFGKENNSYQKLFSNVYKSHVSSSSTSNFNNCSIGGNWISKKGLFGNGDYVFFFCYFFLKIFVI
jgi:hypothetical protein